MATLGLIVLLAAPFAPLLPADNPQGDDLSPGEFRDELEAPVIVETGIGRAFEGRPVDVSATRIVLLATVDEGSVEYTFSRDEIVRVRVPGGNLMPHALDLIAEGRIGEGLALLDKLYERRSPFFPYLPESEPVYFAKAVPIYRAHGRVSAGLALAKALLPWVSDNAEAADLLRDEILLGTYLSGDFERARVLADSWIAEQPRAAESALGWHLLGELQRREGDLEGAFFSFLRPIVFSGSGRMPYLENCYVGAIEIAVILRRPASARRLYSEMIARGLAWPRDRPQPTLSPDIPVSDSPPAQS